MTTDTLAAREADLAETFGLFDDWIGRYEHLIDLGRTLPALPDDERAEPYRIHGCQAQVWVVPEWRDGRLHFRGDSDALITRGLVALLTGLLSGLPPAAIAGADLGVLDRIGLREHLSPTRKNGLAAMIARMKDHARHHLN